MKLATDLEIAKKIKQRALDVWRGTMSPWLLEYASIKLGDIVECPRCSEVQDRKKGGQTNLPYGTILAAIPQYDCPACGLHFTSEGLFHNRSNREPLLNAYRTIVCLGMMHAGRFGLGKHGRELPIDDFHPGMDSMLRSQATTDTLEECARMLKVSPAMVSAKVKALVDERQRIAKELGQ